MMNMRTEEIHNPIVRPATQANRFYEGNPQQLSHEVDSFLALHDGSATYNNVAALIVPHAGYYYSGNVAASAYATLNPQKHYQRIFLLGPSHHEWLDGASVNSEADFYATPLGKVKVDRETTRQLREADSLFFYQKKAHDREHCLEVQLPFLQRRLGNVPPIVPIIISTNDFAHLRRMAEVLKPYFNDDNLFVISSDFSHYPSYEDACEVDARTGEAIASGDVEQFLAAIELNTRSEKDNLATSACGEFAILTLMLMLDSDEDFTLSDQEKKILKGIALQSIKDSLDGKRLDPTLATEFPTLNRNCGAFVSLHKHGQLRGCIGHFGEDFPLPEIVAEMARAAAFEDPRFTPLRREELDDIDIEISVLTPMRRIQSLDEFQLHRHGIYIRKGYRSGTFLPQVADEVNWTKEEFVGHCSRDKAGLGWNGWRDAELYVYEAIVF